MAAWPPPYAVVRPYSARAAVVSGSKPLAVVSMGSVPSPRSTAPVSWLKFAGLDTAFAYVFGKNNASSKLARIAFAPAETRHLLRRGVKPNCNDVASFTSPDDAPERWP